MSNNPMAKQLSLPFIGGRPLSASNPIVLVPSKSPGVVCDGCGFNLRPHLDYVMVQPGRRLCEDCLERELGIETFTIDEWLATHDDHEWRRELVENLLSSC
ncbi:MAG: hypothetical protein L0332_17885 [Chloroflexi bacterium]|nr:hypothetical protein [Chloroflexota bacterium]